MLLQCRRKNFQYAMPKFDIRKEDIDGFMKELKGFHEAYLYCFFRSELRENFYWYMAGQLSVREKSPSSPTL